MPPESHREPESIAQSAVDAFIREASNAEASETEIWGLQFDYGLAWIEFPEGLGGLGLPSALNKLVDTRLRQAGLPANFLRNPIGIGMGAPTLISHASKELAARLLRPLFTCEEIWCQLFSEPGAGSDVAALSARAERDGDEWVVNGQKVWTTLAHVAKWGMLLARSDSRASKHAGLTYFIVDMEAAGVEIRPLRQITGEAEFNEVYFSDVRIADSMRIGPPGGGWSIALTTLMNERVSLGGSTAKRGGGPIGDALRLWKNSRNRTPQGRDTLARLWIEAEVNRMTNLRAASLREAGTPGPEGSVAKLANAELSKKIYNFCQNLLGAEGLLYSSYVMTRPDTVKLDSSDRDSGIQKMFLRSRANSIEGGTSEIMRNILGERVLQLPPEPRLDKNQPFSASRKI